MKHWTADVCHNCCITQQPSENFGKFEKRLTKKQINFTFQENYLSDRV
jgi:hypothetical protein